MSKHFERTPNRFRVPPLALVWAALAVLSVAAQRAPDVTKLLGKWNIVLQTDSGPVQWTVRIVNTDGRLTAYVSNSGGEAPAGHFTYEGGVLRFSAPYQGEDYDIALRVSDSGQLRGVWSGARGSGKTVGTRKP